MFTNPVVFYTQRPNCLFFEPNAQYISHVTDIALLYLYLLVYN